MNILNLFKYNPYRSKAYCEMEQAIHALVTRIGGPHGLPAQGAMDKLADFLRTTVPGVIVARKLEGGGILVMLATGRQDTPVTCTVFDMHGFPRRFNIKRPPVENAIALNDWVETFMLS